MIDSLIVAEGVERPEEFWKLRELGVTFGQGYLFGEPSDDLATICAKSLEELQLP